MSNQQNRSRPDPSMDINKVGRRIVRQDALNSNMGDYYNNKKNPAVGVQEDEQDDAQFKDLVALLNDPMTDINSTDLETLSKSDDLSLRLASDYVKGRRDGRLEDVMTRNAQDGNGSFIDTQLEADPRNPNTPMRMKNDELGIASKFRLNPSDDGVIESLESLLGEDTKYYAINASGNAVGGPTSWGAAQDKVRRGIAVKVKNADEYRRRTESSDVSNNPASDTPLAPHQNGATSWYVTDLYGKAIAGPMTYGEAHDQLTTNKDAYGVQQILKGGRLESVKKESGWKEINSDSELDDYLNNTWSGEKISSQNNAPGLITYTLSNGNPIAYYDVENMTGRVKIYEALNEFEVRRLSGPELDAFGNARVYEISDNETTEGVYYLIIDQENDRVTVAPITTEGTVNQSDALLLQSKINIPSEVDQSGSVVWEGAPLDQLLLGLLGEHSAIVLQDLHVDPSMIGGYDQGFDAAITSDGGDAAVFGGIDSMDGIATWSTGPKNFEVDPAGEVGDLMGGDGGGGLDMGGGEEGGEPIDLEDPDGGEPEGSEEDEEGEE